MKRLYYILMMLVATLTNCSNEPLPAASSGETYKQIYLSVALDKPVTRAPYELTAPTTNKPLSVDVWASTEEYIFPDDGKDGSGDGGDVALHATARFQSGTPQLLNQAIYKPGRTVYFVAMYPQGWEARYEDTEANFTFNGAQDVLFAPQIYGTYGTEYTKTPTLHFRHLLTWLNFELKAEDEDAINAWGKIKNIEIKSSTDVCVDLSANAYNEITINKDTIIDGDTIISGSTIYDYKASGFKFETEDKLPLYHINPASEVLTADTTFAQKYSSGYELETTAKMTAYVMCEPVEGSYTDAFDKLTNEYTLIVETEKRTVEVNIDLKKSDGNTSADYFTGSTMGRKFTIQLNFKLGNTITVSPKMNDWTVGGIIIKDVEE